MFDHLRRLDPDEEDLHEHLLHVTRLFAAAPDLVLRFQREGFAFLGEGAYGDAFMTPEYVEKHWTEWFEIDSYKDHINSPCDQAIVTTRTRIA